MFQVSAFSICFLVIGITVVSSQFVSGDSEDPPISERRTFKHGKPVKILPLIKKHKKFGLVPHVFSKPVFSEVPIIHEAPRPLFKYHKYQGIEVKPVPDLVFTPEPIIETHSVEPPTFHDYAPAFSSDHSLSHDSSVFVYPKPILSSPPFASLPPLKPAFTFIPAPQPIFSSIPISIPAPAPIVRPIQPPAPVFVSIPSLPAPSPPPVFQTIPVKIQTPVLPPLPAPSPAPVIPTVTVAPPPAAPVFTPVASLPPPAIHIPAPTSSPIASFPAPALSPIASFPAPTSSPIPSFSALPSPVPSFSISTPEPEFQYPPSGTPIPSYIKDISLGDISLKESAVPAIETPKYEEVSPVINDESKILDQGFLHKFKGWKADKANAALSYFKTKPVPIPFPQPTKLPLELLPSQAPIHSSVQFTAPGHSLPLAPTSIFFRPQFFPSVKYESFPPNHIESSPTLYNSYGAPIPHDSYASDHTSHERLSSASEEQPVVLPSPNEQKQDQNLIQQQPSQILQELAPKHQPHEQPVYVPEDGQKAKEENKTSEEIHRDVDNYQSQQESNAEDVGVSLRNHKI